MYVRNYSNNDTVVYKAHKNKGHKPIIEDNILPIFNGGIMGDHDTTLYKDKTRNYECNIHTGRYLEELIQNIPDILWASKMKSLLFRMNDTRKYAKEFGLKNFIKIKLKNMKWNMMKFYRLLKQKIKISSRHFIKKKLLNCIID